MLPTSLEVLDLAGGNPAWGQTPNKFIGKIPSKWGALANLKELKTASCGLDGKPLSIRSERFRFRVDMVTFFAGQLPKELGKLVNLKEFNVYGNKIEGQLGILSTTSCSHLTRFIFTQFRTKRRQSSRRNFPIAAFTSEVRSW